MTLKIEILKIARMEYDEARAFYEIEQLGLGIKSENAIKHSLLRIQQYPFAWPLEREEIRRFILHKFPYKILYSILDIKSLSLRLRICTENPIIGLTD